MLLSFITPLIENDISAFLANLEVLLDRLRPLQRVYPDFRFNFYIALQEADLKTSQGLRSKAESLCPEVNVFELNETGVSVARNKALSSLENKSLTRFILFFDARIEYSEFFLHNVVSACYSGEHAILWGFPVFGEEGYRNSGDVNVPYLKDLADILGNPYVWNMVFRSDLLMGIRFDENRGPGKQTKLKSGEDALFLNEVLCRRGSYNVRMVRGEVRHPSRIGELSKYSSYASGQVDLMCVLIEDQRLELKVRIYAFYRYVLFVIASFRFLLKGRQGLRVFSSRMCAIVSRIPGMRL
jgi:hypothetical protein